MCGSAPAAQGARPHPHSCLGLCFKGTQPQGLACALKSAKAEQVPRSLSSCDKKRKKEEERGERKGQRKVKGARGKEGEGEKKFTLGNPPFHPSLTQQIPRAPPHARHCSRRRGTKQTPPLPRGVYLPAWKTGPKTYALWMTVSATEERNAREE